MRELRTVLCPVDLTPLSERELELAVEICQTFGARLLLHHNLATTTADWTKRWEWEGEEHERDLEAYSEPEARKRLEAMIAKLPESVRAEASISRGPATMVLERLAEELPADLMIVGCHGHGNEDHVSVTERLVEDAPCPVLTVHEGRGEGRPFTLRSGEGDSPPSVLVSTDLTADAEAAVEYAFDLARTMPLLIHLLHVVPAGRTERAEQAQRRLAEMVPEELADRVDTHVASGKPEEEIVAAVERLDPTFLLMGQHARGLLRQFLTTNTARRVLHRAERPVWYVPARVG